MPVRPEAESGEHWKVEQSIWSGRTRFARAGDRLLGRCMLFGCWARRCCSSQSLNPQTSTMANQPAVGAARALRSSRKARTLSHWVLTCRRRTTSPRSSRTGTVNCWRCWSMPMDYMKRSSWMNVWGSLEETELGDPQWIRRALTVSRGAPLFHGISAFPCFHTRRDSPGIVNRLSRTGRTATRAIPCYATNAIPC